jgi:hypothetical protein
MVGTEAAPLRRRGTSLQDHPVRSVARLLPSASKLLAGCLIGALAAGQARADAPSNFVAAMGITTADGNVRTQAGVRLSLAAASIQAEPLLNTVRAPLSARMTDVRRCFSEAMVRSATVDGKVVIELEAAARGRLQARLVRDESGDAQMAECMRGALGAAVVKGVPAGTRVEANLTIDNPVARLRAQQAQRPVTADVHMLAGGLAETESRTQAREVGFRLQASAYASQTLGGLNQKFLTGLPGLLDCRRKASRRMRAAEGTLSLSLSVERGRIAHVKTNANSMNDRRVQTCVAAWLERIDASDLAPAEIDATLSFAR